MVEHLLVLGGLLVVCSLGPGLFFVRRLSWDAEEKWSASVGLSFVILYAATFLIYAAGLPSSSHVVLSAVCATLTLIGIRNWRRLFADRQVRSALLAFGLLLAWGLLLLALVRHYSGGACYGDWLEHYERALFFLGRRPADYKFLSYYLLPARPPLMNVVAAHFLAQTGESFALFQVLFLFLNVLIVFPLCLMARALGPRTASFRPVFLLLLLSNPTLWWNATFTWTKLFAGYYVILGLWLYLAGWRAGDGVRLVASFLSLAAGFLVHFSAGPYAFVVALHYAAFVLPKRAGKWREAVLAMVVSLTLLVTWFGWSIRTYGWSETFASNTTASAFGDSAPGATQARIARNVFYSLVPHPLHLSRSGFDHHLDQPNHLGWLRDYIITIYRGNFIFAMGCVGGPLVLYLLVRALRGGSASARSSERWFWILLAVLCPLIGIAAHPTEDVFGVAGIAGQPLILLGVTFLATQYATLPRPLRLLGLAGCVVDFAAGVFLNFKMESEVFRYKVQGNLLEFTAPRDLLSTWAQRNSVDKVMNRLVYLGDYFDGFGGPLQALVVIAFLFAIIWCYRSVRFVGTVNRIMIQSSVRHSGR